MRSRQATASMTTTLLTKVAMTVGLVVTAVFASSCGDDNDEIVKESRDLALRFHRALATSDYDVLVDLVDYPFNFDGKEKDVTGADRLRELLKQHRATIRERIAPANYTEVVTYDELFDGKELAGRSLSESQAKREAKKIGLREGGVIVRCYHRGEDDKEEDGRQYFLAMHRNALGDLKVTTYHD